MNIFVVVVDVLFVMNIGGKMYVVIGLFCLFLYDYCFVICWYWGVGYNVNVGFCRLFFLVGLIGKCFVGDG